jgi:hypothetical protein
MCSTPIMFWTNESISTILGIFIWFKKLPVKRIAQTSQRFRYNPYRRRWFRHQWNRTMWWNIINQNITFRRCKFSVNILAVFENKWASEYIA